jgi:hypothetical protein
MGIYDSCKDNGPMYHVAYFTAIITLIVVGILYETKYIPRNTKYSEESVWWYGCIGLVCIFLLIFFIHFVCKKFGNPGAYSFIKNYYLDTHFWYLSHILAYMTLTIVSPGQWPFWLAIGILWEWFECYTFCFKKYKFFGKYKLPISCSGFYDITANIAGIAIAMWIHSEVNITI